MAFPSVYEVSAQLLLQKKENDIYEEAKKIALILTKHKYKGIETWQVICSKHYVMDFHCEEYAVVQTQEVRHEIKIREWRNSNLINSAFTLDFEDAKHIANSLELDKL